MGLRYNLSFIMGIKHEIRKFLWNVGIDVCKFGQSSQNVSRMRKLFDLYGINTVIDVGANTGQFAEYLRSDIGFDGKVLSFEPLKSEFESLRLKAEADKKWEVFNFALGDVEKETFINIAGNSLSSSLLGMLETHINAAPSSGYVGQQAIEIKRLDSIFEGLAIEGERIYLKIDTQGFEAEVIKGAENSLRFIETVQLEMSLVPLYEGSATFDDLYRIMRDFGFELVAMEEVFSDEKSGKLLQIDGVFHRFKP